MAVPDLYILFCFVCDLSFLSMRGDDVIFIKHTCELKFILIAPACSLTCEHEQGGFCGGCGGGHCPALPFPGPPIGT